MPQVCAPVSQGRPARRRTTTGMILLLVFPGRPLNEVEHATRILDRKELRTRIERRADGLVISPTRRALPESNCAPPICPFFQIDFGKLL
jgi:hypothetical protein